MAKKKHPKGMGRIKRFLHGTWRPRRNWGAKRRARQPRVHGMIVRAERHARKTTRILGALFAVFAVHVTMLLVAVWIGAWHEVVAWAWTALVEIAGAVGIVWWRRPPPPRYRP
jgi:hypothetical protein